MSRLGINTGSNPNDGQGDPLRVAMGKINSNFLEIYNTIGDGFTLTSYASTAGISSLARNLTGSPRINVSGILNTGITTTEHLEVRNIKSTGIVTAVQFIGDGSQLTNVTAVAGGLEVLDDDVRKGVARELNFGENIVSTGPDVVGRVTISVPNITSFATYAELAGISSYADIAGITTQAVNAGFAETSNVSNYSFTSGISSYSDFSGIATESLVSAYSEISGVSTVSFGITGTPNIVVGIVTADSYEGSGTRLTGIITSLIAGSNISISQDAGTATINAVGGGGTGGVAYDQELNTTDDVTFNNLNVSGVATVTGNVIAQYYDLKNGAVNIGQIGYGGSNLSAFANYNFDIQTDISAQGESAPYWRFGGDGTLTAPGNLIAPYYEITNIGTIGAASTSLLLNANSSLVVRTDFAGLGVGGPIWVFNANGNLATPGNVNVSGDITASGNASISGVVTATRFESLPTATPTIGAATSIKLDTITVGVSTDLTVGRNANVSGVVTSTGGFISVGNTTPIQISLVGNQLTFTAVGIGSTTLTLF